MKNKKNIIWLFLLIFGSIWIINKNSHIPYQQDNGFIFGTIYKITYQHPGNLKAEIEAELKQFDGSLSPFNDTSTISRINRNEPVKPDKKFYTCVKRSLEISEATHGAFDITIAPLVNAWGFGFKKGIFPDSIQVDSMMQFTGYRKIHLTENSLKKDDPRILLNCSAVAKGYAVDIVADFLRKKGVKNFMVDIGGEIVTQGVNPNQSFWRIGINKPIDDSLSVNQEIEQILELKDAGLATSGNYRNFYYRDGVKYAHTIDPRTGYPVQQTILSATVIAQDCMTADAYATAFMVMGLEEARRFLEKHKEINAYFIYTGPDGKYQSFYTEGMKQYLP